jgi:hypothetical protein
MNKNISELLNTTVYHKSYGPVTVKEIISIDQCKFVGYIILLDTMKTFIYTERYFTAL